MTVLVTGVGFIGGYVVRDLLAAGEQVVLFGYLGGNGDPNGDLPEIDYIDHLVGGGLRDKVEIVVGDAGDLDAITKAAERHAARSVVHFATLLSAGAQANPWLATHINVMGTANAFEVAARLQMEKVVWASTGDVMGTRSIPESGVVTDDCVPDPAWTYGAAKVMGEKLAIAYADKFGINITGIRPTRVYGFGEYIKLGRGGGSSWLSNLLYRPAVGEGPCVIPFGKRSVDFLYVEDLADAFLKALRFRDPNGASSYLVSGDYRPLQEAFAFVRRLLPDAQITLQMEDLELPPGAGLGFSRRVDSGRATADFGYRRRHNMEAGVYRTINENRVFAGKTALPEPPEARIQDA
jgi:UDP-glucose 4-epimerase